MPVTCQIDRANAIIRMKCTGLLTIEEVLDAFHRLERDPHCPRRLDVLLDVCEQTWVPKQRNVEDAAFAIGGMRSTVQFGICAIVACTDAIFGMLRMFEVLAEDYFETSRVFRSVSKAEAWLACERRASQAARRVGGTEIPDR